MLPQSEPPVSVADICARGFAGRFSNVVKNADVNRPLPREADDLSLACLLLAVEHGAAFSGETWTALEACQQTVTGRGWYDLLARRLALEMQLPPAPFLPAMSELVANLDHHNANLRGWMLDLGWFVQKRLPAEDAGTTLLKNVADTLSGWADSFGLYRSLHTTDEEAWLRAEAFEPPDFADQYHQRLKLLKERGLFFCQGNFWHRKLRVRKLIELHACRLAPAA